MRIMLQPFLFPGVNLSLKVLEDSETDFNFEYTFLKSEV